MIGSLMVITELCFAREIGRNWQNSDISDDNLNNEDLNVEEQQVLGDENDDNSNNHDVDLGNDGDDDGEIDEDGLINLDGGDEDDELRRIDEQLDDEAIPIEASDFATSPDTFEEGTDYHDEDGMIVG